MNAIENADGQADPAAAVAECGGGVDDVHVGQSSNVQ
jgi:hypothetical protein